MAERGEPKGEPPSEAVEDYLTAIWRLVGQGVVGTSALARELAVSAPSATQMLRRLAAARLVTYHRYEGVRLTASGRRVALRVVRAHRLVELFLVKVLGLPWDRVHQEAHRWEHVVSGEALAGMAAALGDPVTDVHGHPIPAADGSVAEIDDVPLSDLAAGEAAVVSQVGDRDTDLLLHLGKLGLRPGTEVRVAGADRFANTLALEVGGRKRQLGRESARQVRVMRARGQKVVR
jgi:DtxR family Mn-dependent transcriptional regulator